MSEREQKHNEEADEGDDEDDISSSEGDDDSGSEEDLSESESDSEAKASAAGRPGGGGDKLKAGSERALVNQPFDEAMDLSESEGSVSEGHDSPKKAARQLKNQPFDEALELSASIQEMESPAKAADAPKPAPSARTEAKPAPISIAKPAAASTGVGAETKNKPFDEEVDLSDSGESVDTNGAPTPDRKSMKAKQQAQMAASSASSAASASATAAAVRKESIKEEKPQPKPAPTAAPATREPPKQAPAPAKQPERKAPEPKKKPDSESSSEASESEEEDDDDEEDEAEESQSAAPASVPNAITGGAGTGSGGHAAIMANAGSYKESDFAHLKVSSDIRELFQYIGRFKAQEIELETRLKCFIPEYIPAVGDMDAFLKIPRPDGEPDNLGLKMLDEPSLSQSDATVLDLQLRATSKKKHGDIVVRSIENAEKTPKEIDRWIKSIADLHRTKPPPQVHYTKAMPDIESLMQVWPEEFEELLGKVALPTGAMDMALEQYIRVICALLDIPVYKNVFESLHVLFTLYLEFRSNQHFMNYDEQLDSNVQAPPPFTARREELQEDFPSSRK